VILSKEHNFSDSFWSQSIGYLFTNVFPLHLGEPARVFVMSSRCSMPIAQVAASALVERLLDVVVILVALLLVLPWMHVPCWSFRLVGYSAD
jgi:hypothetical protein